MKLQFQLKELTLSNIIEYNITHPTSAFLDFIKSKSDIDLIILSSLEENLDWQELLNTHLVEKLNLIKNYKVKIVVNDTCKMSSFMGFDLIRIPAFLLKTVYRTLDENKRNLKWNSTTNKGLILTGKAHGENRIGFLVECVRSGILKNHIYSFFSPKEKNYLEQTKFVFNELCDWDYDSFVKEYESNPDNINIRNTEEDMHYSGFPYSIDLFKNTSISVVLETNLWPVGDNNPFFTEKTYKAIINKHPFLMLNQTNSLSFLKKYGFYTFEEYMIHRNYDSCSDIFERNKLVVDNLNYFLENYKDDINKKIENNYNIMVSYYNNFKDKHPDIFSKLEEDFFIR